jgi:hypothetical protein
MVDAWSSATVANRKLSAHRTWVGRPCAACGGQLVEGEPVTFVPIGPGVDPEERRACREGRVYRGTAVLCHYACATGEEGK